MLQQKDFTFKSTHNTTSKTLLKVLGDNHAEGISL